MLVLTRKLQEKIYIGDNVTITIVRIQGSTVRVGIEAPDDVRVMRGEIANASPAAIDGGAAARTVNSEFRIADSADSEDVDRVLAGRGITGRVSARPRKRTSLRREASTSSAL
jgi:carbon storage regulator CsrA